MRNQKQTRDTFQVNAKDVDEKLAGASKVVKATYRYPYQMHGSFASSCAVADVQAGSATIWSATQAVFPLRSSAAMVLGLRPQDVHVIFKMGSGCYGCNSADTVSYDAAILSQAVGRPVRVQLSRKDEMISENYGYAFLLDEKAGVGADGTILAWDHEAWSPVYGNRPGANQPGNVITGLLAGFEPAAFAARSPAPDPTNYANNSNATPSYYRGGHRNHFQRACSDAQHSLAVLYRTAAISGTAAEHVRARVVHGRDRGGRSGRSGSSSPQASGRREIDQCGERRSKGGELGYKAFAETRKPSNGNRFWPGNVVRAL